MLGRTGLGALPEESPESCVSELISTQFVVTLKRNEGDFKGLLTDVHRGKDDTRLVFEHCVTVPRNETGTPQRIAGRVHVFKTEIASLQEIMRTE